MSAYDVQPRRTASISAPHRTPLLAVAVALAIALAVVIATVTTTSPGSSGSRGSLPQHRTLDSSRQWRDPQTHALVLIGPATATRAAGGSATARSLRPEWAR